MSDVKAYVLGDGRMVSAQDLERFAKSGTGSKKLSEDPFRYRADAVVTPPYELGKLVDFLEINTDHYRCVAMKTQDVCGSYEIVPRDTERDASQGQRDALEAWLAGCHPELTFIEVLQRVWMDREAAGNGYLELIRDVAGKGITGIDHVSATSVRVRKDGLGYLQRRGQAKVYFKRFGDVRAIRASDGAVVDGKLPEAERANELMHFPMHHPKSDYYGLPDFLPALGAIVGNLQVRDYNLQFFDNNAVPQYAVVVQGGDLSDDVAQVISDYFREHIKGQAHSTLVIPVTSKDTEVKLIPLAVQLKDGSFSVYRTGNRDEIIRAHGVPPARVGIIESGNLGSGSGDSQTHTYKDAIVEPRQSQLEYRLNDKLLRDGLGITDWVIQFTDIDLSDDKVNSEVARENVKAGLWTLKEGRHYVGHFTDDEYAGDDVPPFVMTAAGPLPLSEIGATPEAAAPPVVPPAEPAETPEDEELAAAAPADVALGKRHLIRKRRRDAALKRYVDDLTAFVTDFLAEQGREIGKALAGQLTKVAEADIVGTLDFSLWVEQLGEELSLAITGIFSDGGNEALVELGLEAAFDVEHPAAVGYAEKRAAELLKTGPNGGALVESTQTMLKQLIAGALTEGTSYGELAQAIEDSFAFSPERAENIAKYELGTAYVQGNLAGWEESGVVDGYTWSTMGDDRVRPEHLENEAAGVVELGKVFPSGDFWPPSDSGCRCDLIPHVKD